MRSWPRRTWSAGRTRTSRTTPGRVAVDDVLHLHRLEGHQGIADPDGVAGTDVDRQDGAGHRRRDLLRPAVVAIGGRSQRAIDVGRRSELEGDAPPVDIHVRDAIRREDGPARGRRRRIRHGHGPARPAVRRESETCAVRSVASRPPRRPGRAPVRSRARGRSCVRGRRGEQPCGDLPGIVGGSSTARRRPRRRARWAAARSARACRSAPRPRGRPAGGRASGGTGDWSSGPSTTVSSSAADNRSIAARRSAPAATIFASIGSNRSSITLPGSIPVSTRTPAARVDRPADRLDPTGRRQEPEIGILGVEPDLDGVDPAREEVVDLGLAEVERQPARDPELVRDEVAPGRHLGDRVLDLEPRVHLEEVPPVVVDQELARARRRHSRRRPPARGRRRRGFAGGPARRPATGSPRGPSGAAAGPSSPARPGGRRARGRRTGPAPRRAAGPTRYRSRMSRSSPNAAAASRRADASAAGRSAASPDDAHPLAAAAGRRLDDERQADRRGGGRERDVRLVGLVVAGNDRDTEARREASRCPLVAHRADGRRRRADPDQAGLGDALGEDGVLAQEAEPGMDRVGAGSEGGTDRRVRIEQVDRRASALARDHRPRMPRRSQVRRMRAAISPRLATNSVSIGRSTPSRRDGRGRGRAAVSALPTMNASNASDATRHRPPTRRAGRTPVAIQRWTVRVEVPRRAAAWLGRRSASVMARLSCSAPEPASPDPEADAARRIALEVSRGVRDPGRSALLDERAEALLRLGGLALPRDHPRGVPLRRAVGQAAHLADDRLRGTGGRRSGGEEVGDRGHRPPRRARASPSTTSWTRPIRWARTASNRRPPGNSARALRLADLGDDERRDHRRQDAQPRLREPEPGARSRR